MPEDRQQFSAEYLWSLEAGWKGRDEADRLRADFNIYYMRREHPQVSTSLQLDPTDPLTFIFLTDNAESGEAWGFESSADFQLNERLVIEAMLSWMESRYHGYRFGDRDLEGRAWAHAPEWKSSLSATWRHPAGWMARVDLSGESGFYFDTSHDQRADSRFLANVRTGLRGGAMVGRGLGPEPLRRALPGPRLLLRERAARFPDEALPALGRPAPARSDRALFLLR